MHRVRVVAKAPQVRWAVEIGEPDKIAELDTNLTT